MTSAITGDRRFAPSAPKPTHDVEKNGEESKEDPMVGDLQVIEQR